MIINFIHNEKDSFSPNNVDITLDYSNSEKMRYTFWQDNFIPKNWYSKAAIDFLYIYHYQFMRLIGCARENLVWIHGVAI